MNGLVPARPAHAVHLLEHDQHGQRHVGMTGTQTVVAPGLAGHGGEVREQHGLPRNHRRAARLEKLHGQRLGQRHPRQTTGEVCDHKIRQAIVAPVPGDVARPARHASEVQQHAKPTVTQGQCRPSIPESGLEWTAEGNSAGSEE